MTKSLYFELFTDVMYGNCFRFNSGLLNGILKSILGGNTYGLNIAFNLQINDSLIINIDKNTDLPYTLLNCETFLSTGSRNEFKV